MGAVDLHLHSTASDGNEPPSGVVRRAFELGIQTIALTDHDTTDGLEEATVTGRELGLRVIAGCEFSVEAWWGELHLLAYFLPLDDADLGEYLAERRRDRVDRAKAIVARLQKLGVRLPWTAVEESVVGHSIGRPHIARAMVTTGCVGSINEAFDRYLADGGPAYVPRDLPPIEEVTALVAAVGGLTSAAHLKHRGTRENLVRLNAAGVDAIEVLHPAHDLQMAAFLDAEAERIGMLRTGGSDWHGDQASHRESIGSIDVPEAWLASLVGLHQRRLEASHSREQALG